MSAGVRLVRGATNHEAWMSMSTQSSTLRVEESWDMLTSSVNPDQNGLLLLAGLWLGPDIHIQAVLTHFILSSTNILGGFLVASTETRGGFGTRADIN
jgi:hypothetical protein